jgi:RHS repeat-associated protein
VLEELNDYGSMVARYTAAGGSYFAPWLHVKRSTGESRWPAYDAIGTVRFLVDESGHYLRTQLAYDHAHRVSAYARYWFDLDLNPDYSATYAYDTVGNRTSMVRDGTTYTYSYDDNDKVTSATSGSLSATLGYDGAGNMTSITANAGNWAMEYDDESRLTSISYPGGSDSFVYNALGQRMRATLNGSTKRYVYFRDRVLEETDDEGSMLARYTLAAGSYYAPLLHEWYTAGSLSRYPLYDGTGTVCRLVDDSGAKTDYYTATSFGQQYTPSGTTPNPYRYDGAWGYITDVTGSRLVQLGARFYHPSHGRFLQQDPIGDGVNWYAYVGSNPVVWVDPEGLW